MLLAALLRVAGRGWPSEDARADAAQTAYVRLALRARAGTTRATAPTHRGTAKKALGETSPHRTQAKGVEYIVKPRLRGGSWPILELGDD